MDLSVKGVVGWIYSGSRKRGPNDLEEPSAAQEAMDDLAVDVAGVSKSS